MVNIVEVKTKKDIKKFVDFPTGLYKGVKQYVHPLRMDEFNNFNPKKNASFEDCEAVYFLAYKEGKLVGRIAGILQKLYNAKVNEKRVRFTRFDCINDVEVAQALFKSVEDWAKSIGMDTVHGPMGFNDLDREGMLIEGFDEIATFEEAYNYDYYKDLMVACGYEKEVDWVEYNITMPKQIDEKFTRVADLVQKKYNLRSAEKKGKKAFIKKYAPGIFKLLDEAYGSLYGVVPYTDKVRQQVIDQFNMFISLDFMSMVLDENDDVIAFGFAIPSLSEVVNKYEGRLTLCSLPKLLKAVKKPTQLDLALIAVKPEYQAKGASSLVFTEMIENFIKRGIKTCETNLNLETNVQVMAQWKYFDSEQHKRRRSYIKKI